MDDLEARAYFALCDAQGVLNALLDDDGADPAEVAAARQAWHEAHAAWLTITGMDEGDDE